MKTTILATKTGQVNMGGYFKEKTAQVYTTTYIINGEEEQSKYFRFSYVGDSTDECYTTLAEAMIKFNKETKSINE